MSRKIESEQKLPMAASTDADVILRALASSFIKLCFALSLFTAPKKTTALDHFILRIHVTSLNITYCSNRFAISLRVLEYLMQWCPKPTGGRAPARRFKWANFRSELYQDPVLANMDDSRPLKLIIATPCYGGLVTQRYMQCICTLLQYTAAQNISVQVEMLGHESLITRGRNTLVSKFLDMSDATHLMFIDADIGFDVEQVLRMLVFDRDIVAGMYPLKVIDWNSAALNHARAGEPLEHAPLRFVGTPCAGEEAERDGEFLTGEYAGTGFMLIKRDVFARMIKSYSYLKYAAAHNATVPSTSSYQYALFDCMIDPQTSEYLSEDYAFCKRWRALGGKIWLDTAGRLAHIGSYEFLGTPKRRFLSTEEA